MTEERRQSCFKSYPIESCTHHETTTWTTTTPESEATVMLDLPPTIRALRDSERPHPHGRTLVICLDGTGDKFDGDNTNVVNIMACLKKDDPSQVTYYQSGIGTYNNQGGLKKGFSAALDMSVGSGLGIHIMDAYKFLMQNYHEGDRICLLGFSRGSYSVRCLAGMLHKAGLLPAHNRAQVKFAYEFYKNDTPEGWKMSAMFKRTFCTDVTVYFMGVFDCVASVGFIPRRLPFSKSPPNTIHHFRHAMALDEHRAKFKICQWQQQNPAATPMKANSTQKFKSTWTHYLQKKVMQSRGAENETNGKKETETNHKKPRERNSSRSKSSNLIDRTKEIEDQITGEDAKKQKAFEANLNKEDHRVNAASGNVSTNVLEVWFAGCHADVGGGAVANEERHMLSRIPLRWMLRQCFECDTGIIFSTGALAETGLDVHSLWPTYQMRSRPVVGPSPRMIEWYESRTLAPLRRRSTVLGLDDEKSIAANAKHQAEMQGQDPHAIEHPGLLPEHAEDYFDALAPLNDMLVIAKGWWILEMWPIKLRVLKTATAKHRVDDEGDWQKVVRMNLGRYRAVREDEPNIHWTAQMRMAEMNPAYKVQNRLGTETLWQVAC